MKLEYIILLGFALGFYYINYKDYKKSKEKRRYIEDNLKQGSKIITKSGIIGYVSNIDKNTVIFISGDDEHFSHICIDKAQIDNIL